MNLYARHLVYLLLILIIPSVAAYDNAHFYRATNLFFEPRLERDYLSSFDFFFQAGSTSKAHNFAHDTVPLLDIYGPSNMHELAIGVPGKDLSNPLDMIITQLALLPSRCVTSIDASRTLSQFASYSIDGTFSILEGIFSYAQNLKRGFFIHFYFPIRRLKISNIHFCDISPEDDACPNSNTPIWQTFKNNFDAILARYNLSRRPFNKTSIGDMTFLLGWTHSFQETEILDFVDTTFKAGMLIPSGTVQCIDEVFSLPFGYDGHWAFVLAGDMAFGAFDWLTLGLHFDTLIFAARHATFRLKTGEFQSGLFKLATSEARRDKGAIYELGAYLKADHFVRGLSLVFGYSFANKNRDEITPTNLQEFDAAIASSDEALQSWKMHTLNFVLEYDFSHEKSIIGPRMSIYYNLPVGGKRIFMTAIGGGNIGIDIAWDL